VREALFALGGVILGAALNYVLGWRVDARRDGARTRGAARLFYRDVFNATLAIHAALAKNEWPLRDDTRNPFHLPENKLNLTNWDRLSADFTAAVSNEDDWETVCLAFESMQNEKELIATQDERVYNPDRLQRVRDRDLMPALGVLDRMRTPLHRRIGRFESRVRRLDGRFLIPRQNLKRKDD
jgi:hypothetical protein